MYYIMDITYLNDIPVCLLKIIRQYCSEIEHYTKFKPTVNFFDGMFAFEDVMSAILFLHTNSRQSFILQCLIKEINPLILNNRPYMLELSHGKIFVIRWV